MRLLAPPLSLLLVWLWNAYRCDAAQIPLGSHKLHQPSTSLSSPLDDKFEKLVNWTLEHFQTPGLAVAVIRGNDTFLKVSMRILV
jgi:CubicO group peptidase (beta-lactamase class C family)